jgi:hypothetical protein
MALLRMLCRAAFICNLCFLLAIGIVRFRFMAYPELNSTILVMGFFIAVMLNFLVCSWLFIRWLVKKPTPGISPVLIYVNGGFMVIQLIFIFK